VLFVLVGMMVLMIVLMPLTLVQRYRVGTSRRRGRGWIASINVFAMAISAVLFLLIAGVMNFWLPHAFPYAVAGFTGGALLGLLGLALTHWERTPDGLHYTPNRWLTLLIVLAVTTRLIYGFWRGWHAWSSADSDGSWLQASGAAGSLAVGALVLGYYFTFWAGVSRRIKTSVRQSP
jgi:hypothetical protein